MTVNEENRGEMTVSTRRYLIGASLTADQGIAFNYASVSICRI